MPQGFTPAGQVTVVVRPSMRSWSTAARGAMLAGTVENIVYFGTDTHFHVRLDDGEPFIVRQQNSAQRRERLREPATRSASRSATTPRRS